MDFLLTVCMAAIASALFRILVPENKFTKQIALLIACVFLLAGINAVTGAELDLDADIFEVTGGTEYIGFSGNVNEELKEQICGDMTDKLYALMHENGIYPRQIHIGVNISGLYSISITQVKLVLGEDMRSRSDEALALLREQLPEDMDIRIEFKEVRS